MWKTHTHTIPRTWSIWLGLGRELLTITPTGSVEPLGCLPDPQPPQKITKITGFRGLGVQGGGENPPPPPYNSNCTKERSSSTSQVPATIAVSGWIWLWYKLICTVPGLSGSHPGTGWNPPSPRPLKAPFSPVTLREPGAAPGPAPGAPGRPLRRAPARMCPCLPACGGASGSRGGNPPCRRLARARVPAGGGRADERLCGCAGCRYRATDCGAGLAILWDASAIEIPVRFAHCARCWKRISWQTQGTLRVCTGVSTVRFRGMGTTWVLSARPTGPGRLGLASLFCLP